MITATSFDQVDALAFHLYRQDGQENSLLEIAEFENTSAEDAYKLPFWLTD
jgi:hypothetical protein